MQDSEPRVPPSEDSKIAYPIEERMTIDGPPARVLDGIARYFRSRDNILDLVVPLKRVGEPGTLALSARLSSSWNIIGIDCFRDNMISRCHSNGDRRVIHGLASLGGSLSGHQAAERKLPSRGIINLLSSLLTLRLELSSMSTPHMLPVGC